MSSEPPTPYDIYSFFRTLRDSLTDENDYYDLVGTLFIPHNVMPLSEMEENVLPYFRRSTDPNLFTHFQVFIRNAEKNEAFESTFMRVVEALDILEKIDDALNNVKRLFEGYLQALQLDNASASHEEVMNSLQKFLNEKCNTRTQLRVRKVFAEESAAEELGLSYDVLAAAAAIINDDALYIQILQTLQLNHRQNLSWEAVIIKIQKLVEDNKPAVWSSFYEFLDGVHRGVHVTAPTYYYPYPDSAEYQADYEDGDYAAYCEQFEQNQVIPREEDSSTIPLEQQFANVSLDNERDGVVDAEPKQHPEQTVY